MTQPEPIRVNGLREFVRNLKKIDADLPKALRAAFNEAADLVVGKAKPQVPRRSGRAAASLKARSTRTEVRVRGGGNRAPYYPWLDFGGRVGRRLRTRRPFIKEGRYLYASYFDLSEAGAFQEGLNKALLDVARQAGVDIEEGS